MVILKINEFELAYNVSTLGGSSGSPIFLENSTEVFGMHKSGLESKKENYGDLIYPVVKDLESNINIINNNNLDRKKIIIKKLYYPNGKIKYDGDMVDGKFEGNGKYYYDDGRCYIGDWKNNLRHGKGILYYKNGNINYDGDWNEDKREGTGKKDIKMVLII